MRMWRRSTRQLLAVVALMMSTAFAMPLTGSAQPVSYDGPGDEEPVTECQDGGWQNLLREDRTGFVSEDECTRYALGGGVFSDVTADCLIAQMYDYGAGITPDLSGTVLGACELQGDLRFVDFSGADMTNVSIANSSFREANLQNANLTNAQLESVSFLRANLSGATMTRVTYQHGSFIRADVTNVDFAYAQLEYVFFAASDLTGSSFLGATFWGVRWDQSICPDGTNAWDHGDTCEGHLVP